LRHLLSGSDALDDVNRPGSIYWLPRRGYVSASARARLPFEQLEGLPQPVIVHERTSAVRRNLEHLSSDAGAGLLRALGVKGNEADLRNAIDEFRGHCLALSLLGGYLSDAYQGEIRYRKEVSERLGHDVRQGAHARRVMDSYQSWLGEGPELSVLRILGLFDRPADEKALAVLLKPPAIPGLTESLIDLSLAEWRTILAKLRRAKLLAREDPHHPGQLDTHPLVREYFGEQKSISLANRAEASYAEYRAGLSRL